MSDSPPPSFTFATHASPTSAGLGRRSSLLAIDAPALQAAAAAQARSSLLGADEDDDDSKKRDHHHHNHQRSTMLSRPVVLTLLLASSCLLLLFTASSTGNNDLFGPSSHTARRHLQSSLSCAEGGERCRVQFTTLSSSEVVHSAELFPEEHSLFADNLVVVDDAAGTSTVLSKQDRAQLYSMYHTKPGAEQWGAALVDASTNTLVSGLFLTKHGDQVIEHNIQANRHHRHRQLEGGEEDTHVVLEMPGVGQPWLNKTTTSSDVFSFAGKTFASLVSAQDDAAFGTIQPFFPQCFKDDAITQVFKMDVVYDYGLASTFPSTAAALADLDVLFSAGKLVFLSQLNIRLEIGTVTLGSATSEVPLNRGGSNACGNALGALPEISAWADAQPRTGFTLLLSNCFSGVVGVSYIGSACSVNRFNANVAAHSWLIAFHELGHAFGMSHSFEHGMGRTGGLMDYGDGLYRGVAQFHPNKRSEVCTFLDYTVPTCPFLTPADSSSSCGDGILSKNEACECLQQGSTECGRCRQCQLTGKSDQLECSAEDFVLRVPGMPNTVVVANVEYLADKECCTAQNRFAPAKTMCSAAQSKQKVNSCSRGKCVEVCGKYLSFENANCGYDDSGCMLGCVFSNKCNFALNFAEADGTRTYVSDVGDGTRCLLASSKESGVCHNRVCVPQSEYNGGELSSTLEPTTSSTSTTTGAPTSPETPPPTLPPTTRNTPPPTPPPTTRNTPSPTTPETPTPTASPTGTEAPALVVCSAISRPVPCDQESQCRWNANARRCVRVTLPPTTSEPTPFPTTEEPTSVAPTTLRPTRRPTTEPTVRPTRQPTEEVTDAPTSTTTATTPLPTRRPTFSRPTTSPTTLPI